MERDQEKKYPLVSITMITWNRKDDVRVSLDNVFKIDYPNYEVIVVDNGSVDGVTEMIELEFPKVRIIKLPRNLRLLARNISFQNAKGEYIVTLDDDSYPEPDAIKKMVARFDTDPVLGIIGFQIPCGDYFSTWNWYETSAGLVSTYIGSGAGIRKEAFEQVGYYDEALGGYAEELDLSYRAYAAGYTVGHFKDIIAHHRPRYNYRRVYRFFYGNTRNLLYLTGKFIYPRYWFLFYLRFFFFGLHKSYNLGGKRALWWTFVACIGGPYHILRGYWNRIELPSILEYYVRYSRYYYFRILPYILKQKESLHIRALQNDRAKRHDFCPRSPESEEIIDERLSREHFHRALRAIFELEVKFNVAQFRNDEKIKKKIFENILSDLRQSRVKLGGEISAFEDKFNALEGRVRQALQFI